MWLPPAPPAVSIGKEMLWFCAERRTNGGGDLRAVRHAWRRRSEDGATRGGSTGVERTLRVRITTRAAREHTVVCSSVLVEGSRKGKYFCAKVNKNHCIAVIFV